MSSITSTDFKTSLLIFGAGGHGRVVADAALLARQWQSIVVSDRKPPSNQDELLPGVRILEAGAEPGLNTVIHIAIGDNLFRQNEADLWGRARLMTVVHPMAVVSPFSNIAVGCFVAAGAVVGPLARIGLGVIVNHCAVVDHDVEVGAFSHIAPKATLGGQVKLGQRVLIGSGAVVLASIVIGDDVTVGAGAVVNANLPEPGTYVGIPARKIR